MSLWNLQHREGVNIRLPLCLLGQTFFCPLYLLPSFLTHCIQGARDGLSVEWGEKGKGEELAGKVKKENTEHALLATKIFQPEAGICWERTFPLNELYRFQYYM